MHERIIIGGPCAAESRNQVVSCAQEIKRNITCYRANLWKPRTSPGFEGVGIEGIPWLKEVAEMGMSTATEVLLNQQAEFLVDNLVTPLRSRANFIFWFGARNQNHFVQGEIARTLRSYPEVRLMIKNQPWKDEGHWLGIVEHVLEAGFPSERIILCHRGFHPEERFNPHGLRNLPDWEMAMRVREKAGMPMIVDPSHIGGTAQNVFLITKEARKFDFDGIMVEVNPNPNTAKTDAPQQITPTELKRLLAIFGIKKITESYLPAINK